MNPLSDYCPRCGSNLIVAQHAMNCPHRPQPNTLYAEIDRLRAELSEAHRVTNMLVLCGEVDAPTLPDKLRALIDGLIEARTELAQARLDLEYWKAKAQRPALNSTKA